MRLRLWAVTGVAVSATATVFGLSDRSQENRPLNEIIQCTSRSFRDRISQNFPSQTLDFFSLGSKVAAASPFLSNESKIDADSRCPKTDGGEAEVQKWDDNWDLRDPEFLGSTEYPKATRYLILIRHGQYHLEHDDDADRKLTELGRKQLQLTGHRLKEISCQLNMKYDKIFVSTMTRALESADIIAGLLPDVPRELPGDALLREGSPYPPEPPNWDVVKSRERTAKKLQSYFVDGPRIESAFRKYFHRAAYDQKEDSTEIIVCHANVIRYFVMRALQLPPEAWLRISLRNGSITLLAISPRGKVSLRSLGDAGHMPPDCLTTT